MTAHRSTVLVIDDEPQFAYTLERILADTFDVTVVTRSATAIGLFDEGRRYDVVVTEIGMSGPLDGPGLQAYVAAMDPEQAERFVFTTTGILPSRGWEFLRRQVGRCLYKPFAPNYVQRVVSAVAGVPHARPEAA